MSADYLFASMKVRGLPPPHKYVLAQLADHADATGRTIVGLRKLAEETGFSHRTVRYAMEALEQLDLIARRRRHRETGEGRGKRTSDETKLDLDAIRRLAATSAPNQEATIAPDMGDQGQNSGETRGKKERGQGATVATPETPSGTPRGNSKEKKQNAQSARDLPSNPIITDEHMAFAKLWQLDLDAEQMQHLAYCREKGFAPNGDGFMRRLVREGTKLRDQARREGWLARLPGETHQQWCARTGAY
jgi:predicted transcriptional regulator